MKMNMSMGDRLWRWFFAVVFISLNVSGVVTGILGIVLYVLAIVFIITSIVRFCPTYTLFGMNTCPEDERA